MSGDQYDSLDYGQTGGDMSIPPPLHETSLGDQSTAGDMGESVSDFAGGPPVVPSAARIQSDRYHIERELGAGGMGQVLLATDTQLDRKVALKRLKAEISGSQRAVERFQTEARAIAALDHTSIVRVYDYGFDARGPLLVLEFVDGPSLADRLREGPVDVQQAVEWTCDLCDALHVAHGRQIIHRDIKPANILLTTAGVPKLTDFGLARRESHDTSQTQAGVILGTLDFMPPEQRRDASAVDARSDLWSLGATLYQMVTGRSPRVLRLDLLPESLRPVLARILEDDPALRYSTAVEFRDALRSAISQNTALDGWRKRVGGLRDAVRAAIDPGEASSASDAATPVIAGMCPTCGTECETDRAFCPGCGNSLQTSCLKCDTAMGAWERFCPSCGSGQQELIDNRLAEIASLREEAEKARSQNLCWDAIRSARLAQQLADPRIPASLDWAEQLVQELMAQQSRMDAQLRQMQTTARQQLDQRNFEGALETLASLAELPADPASQTAEMGECLRLRDQARHAIAEADRLQQEILAAVKARQFDGLLARMDHFLTLRPGHAVVTRLREKLLEQEVRQLRKSHRLDERVKSAVFYQQQDDYESVIELLGELPAVALNEKAGELLAWARNEQQQVIRQREKVHFFQRPWFIIAICATILLVLIDWVSRAEKRRQSAVPVTPAGAASDSSPDSSSSGSGRGLGGSAPQESPGSGSIINRIDSSQTEPAGTGGSSSTAQTTLPAGAFQRKDGRSTTDVVNAAIAASTQDGSGNSPPGGISRPTPRGRSPVAAGRRAGELRQFTDLPLPLVWCPPGLAAIGGGMTGSRGSSRTPLRSVRVEHGFWVSQTEITQQVWTAVMQTTPWDRTGSSSSRYVRSGPDYPASNINLETALLFSLRLTERERAAGRLPDDWEYVLPDEVQWEYACRAGTTTAWHCGDDPSELGRYAWYLSNTRGEQYPHEVAKKMPNPWQLYDMHGNLFEWSRPGRGTSSTRTVSGSQVFLRGGAWMVPEDMLRSSAQFPAAHSGESPFSGVRLVLQQTDES